MVNYNFYNSFFRNNSLFINTQKTIKMKKIKIKFFVIGFLSSVLTISLIIFGFLKYLESERIEQFKVENKKEISNLQYSIIDLKKR